MVVAHLTLPPTLGISLLLFVTILFASSRLVDSFQILPSNTCRGRSNNSPTLRMADESRTWDQRGRRGISRSNYRREERPWQRQPIRRKKTKPLPITGYDSNAIVEFYDRRPLEVGWRLNSLGFPLLGWYLGLLMDKFTGNDAKEVVQRMRGEELRHHLVRTKSVALIKSGQALSLRPDLIRNKIWAEELGKLVDAVGGFPDDTAMNIMRRELSDLLPKLRSVPKAKKKRRRAGSRFDTLLANDPILSLFEFYNDGRSVASASIGQVYKARIRRGARLEAAIGPEEAAKWAGKIVAIKVQRQDAIASASLDMYLIRRAAMWLSLVRGGDLPGIADQFGTQLFGELDYVREANNCDRFRELYGQWDEAVIPKACAALTRKKVLVMEWIDGEKGPWSGEEGIEMVRVGLKCSVDQLMSSGLFHSDPHRGNLLRTPDARMAFLDFGMMADVSEVERYGLIGLVIGLQNKDLPLITENLLKLRFLDDTTQLDSLVPRLRKAVKNSTGGTGKASDINFAQLQAELDEISRENVLRFSVPPFFTTIMRSLAILEGMALSVDPDFRIVRGSYPYVLRQLLSDSNSEQGPPAALQKLLVRLLTVNGDGLEIEWARLRDLLRLASKATSKSKLSSLSSKQDDDDGQDSAALSRQTIELFFKFLTSRTGLFLKTPLVNELAESIDGMASIGEASLLRLAPGLPHLPGQAGPVNPRRMEELQLLLHTFQEAFLSGSDDDDNDDNQQALFELAREFVVLLNDEEIRQDAGPILEEVQSVVSMVAVQVLEIRGSRAMRSMLQLSP